MTTLRVRGGTDATGSADVRSSTASPSAAAPALDADGLTVLPASSTSRSTAPPASTSPPSRTGSGTSPRRCRRTASTAFAADRHHLRPRGPRRARWRSLAAGPPAGWAGAVPLGLHFEGPMLAPTRKGAHPEQLAAPRRRSTWSTAGRARPASLMVTLAPELPGALEVDRGAGRPRRRRVGRPHRRHRGRGRRGGRGRRHLRHPPRQRDAAAARPRARAGRRRARRGRPGRRRDRRRPPPRPATFVRAAWRALGPERFLVGLRHHRGPRAARRARPARRPGRGRRRRHGPARRRHARRARRRRCRLPRVLSRRPAARSPTRSPPRPRRPPVGDRPAAARPGGAAT